MISIQELTKETRNARIMRHLIFWSVFFLLDLLKYQLITSDPIQFGIVFNLCALLPQIAFTYILSYGIVPLLLKKRMLLAVFLFIIVSYHFAVVNRLMIVHIAEELMLPPDNPQESIQEIITDWRFLLKRYMPSNLWVALVFIFVKYFFEKERLVKKELGIEKEQIGSELKALKAQLNPHFLFNTLNNIYSLSVANSPQTSDAIGKLSDMLDQILYRSNEKFIPLKDELQLIENYIDLEQLRYAERLNLNLVADMKSEGMIPPLILLTLVENAFKHGAAEDDGSPEIEIVLRSDDEKIYFNISNSVVENKERSDKVKIGLKNIREQLDLLYGESYKIKIDQSQNRYTVLLEIEQKG